MAEDDGDTLRLLLSTDNHLGYAEKDPVRGEDSFRTFAEVLKLAQAQRADLLLLGGDLFHENKPSRRTLYQTMSLLRQHCMGDGAVRFQVVSDQSINFPNFGAVNYEDPNYNIELPVFSIHGNHDDPSREAGGGAQALAALDLLAAANLVNYFGKSERADAVEVFPVLVAKGATRVAIYGLGSMRDERLHRMFTQQKVVFRRPAERPEDWFSIFVVHQNRADRGRGAKNCLPESFIPDFVDFVLWGHEHECLVEPQESLQGEFFISQPGSSVATSLVEGEAREKRVAVLEVRGQHFRLRSHALTTVRPFKMAEVVLADVDELDPNDPDVAERMREVLEARVDELLQEAAVEMAARETPAPLRQVLVRLRVEHSGFPVLVNQRFGSRFVGRVANTNDMLLFFRRKRERVSALDAKALDKSALLAPVRPPRLDSATVETILGKRLHLPDRKMVFLPEEPLATALDTYVVKNQPAAIDELVDAVLEETQKELAAREARSAQDIHSAVERRKERADADRRLRLQEAAEGNGGGEAAEGNGAGEAAEGNGGGEAAEDNGAGEAAEDNGGRQTDKQPRAAPRRSRFASRFYTDDAADEDAADEDAARAPTSSARRRFGAARSVSTAAAATAAVAAAAAAPRAGSDDDKDKRSASASASARPTAAPGRKAARAVRPQRKAAGRASARVVDSDESEWVEASDGDEDFEMEEEEESEVTQPAGSRRRGVAAAAKPKAKAKAEAKAESKPKAAARGRKRLRQLAASPSDEDEDEESAVAVERPAKTRRARAQPSISELFQRQAAADEVESDAEFTQLTSATPASTVPLTQQPGERYCAAAAWSSPSPAPSETQASQASQASQSQSSARRKLPLSMLASQSGGADSARGGRKGWGRTRR